MRLKVCEHVGWSLQEQHCFIISIQRHESAKLGQDLCRGQHDLKAGMHKVANHLHSDEQAIGRAASRSIEQRMER